MVEPNEPVPPVIATVAPLIESHLHTWCLSDRHGAAPVTGRRSPLWRLRPRGRPRPRPRDEAAAFNKDFDGSRPLSNRERRGSSPAPDPELQPRPALGTRVSMARAMSARSPVVPEGCTGGYPTRRTSPSAATAGPVPEASAAWVLLGMVIEDSPWVCRLT